MVVLPLGARGKCLESFQPWRPSLAGEQAGAHCHQGLARWHRPWLFLYWHGTRQDLQQNSGMEAWNSPVQARLVPKPEQDAQG